MKKGQLFILTLLTALCVYLICTSNSTLCAVGITLSIFTSIGWYDLLNNLDNKE